MKKSNFYVLLLIVFMMISVQVIYGQPVNKSPTINTSLDIETSFEYEEVPLIAHSINMDDWLPFVEPLGSNIQRGYYLPDILVLVYCPYDKYGYMGNCYRNSTTGCYLGYFDGFDIGDKRWSIMNYQK